MSAPPVSPQPVSPQTGTASAEQAADERPSIAAAAPSVPNGAAVTPAASKSQVLGAWVFGTILLGLLVVFLYFPPPKGGTVTGFCIEAVITAIFAGLFGYFILGATNQNWNWKITENLSVSIQATGGFALTIGTAALFLGVYYWHSTHPPTATTTPPASATSQPPAPAVTPGSDVNALNAKVLTVGPLGVLELGTLERGMQRLGYQPGDTVAVTISGQQYQLPYVQNRADAAQGEDYLFIIAPNKRVGIATQGQSFAAKHGVKVGTPVELLKKQ
jgi:hypothetical protein